MLVILVLNFYLVAVQRLNTFLFDDFIFSPRYRIARHLMFWALHIIIWAGFWIISGVSVSYTRMLLNMAMWVPLFIFFGYPLVYGAIPQLLLKGRVVEFFITVILWGAAGLYLDVSYRGAIYIPLQEKMGLTNILPRGPLAFCYLCMTTSAAGPMVFKFFQLLELKRRELMLAHEQKSIAELQVLKAQIHPHFLFNTLNNIYAFSLTQSAKTPQLIRKLSSLMNYMMYECRADQVLLSREIEIIKDYIGLEKERYGNRIDITLDVDADDLQHHIAPLLLLPFIENAFKHGLSEQLDMPRLMISLVVRDGMLTAEIVNNCGEYRQEGQGGIGIRNVRERIALLYPDRHALKVFHQEKRFTVQMQVLLQARLPKMQSAYKTLVKDEAIVT